MSRFFLGVLMVSVVFLSWIKAKQGFNFVVTETGKKIKTSELVSELGGASIILFGEEHDDSLTHVVQFTIFKQMHTAYGDDLVLSMEMFDRDVQYIMDEYLNGQIKRSFFITDARAWSNYKDYEPLIDYAKMNGIPVVCANAPFRYVNLVSHKGFDALDSLSLVAKKSLPPRPIKPSSTAYRAKIKEKVGQYMTIDSTGYDLMRGQALWNATMAYSIAECVKNKADCKVFHLCGRMHSDYGLGIPEQLVHYDNTLTNRIKIISSSKKKLNLDKELADYVLQSKLRVK